MIDIDAIEALRRLLIAAETSSRESDDALEDIGRAVKVLGDRARAATAARTQDRPRMIAEFVDSLATPLARLEPAVRGFESAIGGLRGRIGLLNVLQSGGLAESSECDRLIANVRGLGLIYVPFSGQLTRFSRALDGLGVTDPGIRPVSDRVAVAARRYANACAVLSEFAGSL